MNEQIDHNIPFELLHLQAWFGQNIAQPLADNGSIQSISATGSDLAREAEKWITPNTQLQSIERLQIYNQQYWWRLVKILGELLPTILRLFGHRDFNHKIAVPYLTKFPPNSWLLRTIGDNIINWLDNDYTEQDKELIKALASIDLAFENAYRAPRTSSKVVSEETLNKFLTHKVIFQADISLLGFSSDLFSLRKQLLNQDANYWQQNPLPDLIQQASYRIIYRQSSGTMMSERLDYAEYIFLNHLKSGMCIEEVCEKIEQQEDALFNDVAQNLERWSQEWLIKNLFITPDF